MARTARDHAARRGRHVRDHREARRRHRDAAGDLRAPRRRRAPASGPSSSPPTTTTRRRRSTSPWEIGATLAEFPVTMEAAIRQRERGMPIVVGAPNIVRGGSTSGNLDAVDLVSAGLADIIVADYHAPSLLVAAFRLVDEGHLDIPAAIRMLTLNAARAVGLHDRGAIVRGPLADLALVRLDATGTPSVEAGVPRRGAASSPSRMPVPCSSLGAPHGSEVRGRPAVCSPSGSASSPMIDPTARVVDSDLGAWTGSARTHHRRIDLRRLQLRRWRCLDCVRGRGQVLLDRLARTPQPRQPSDGPRDAAPHDLSAGPVRLRRDGRRRVLRLAARRPRHGWPRCLDRPRRDHSTRESAWGMAPSSRAGAVVTKDVEPYTIVGGVPAKLIRMRFPADIVAKLEAVAWWDWPRDLLDERFADFVNLETFLDRYC